MTPDDNVDGADGGNQKPDTPDYKKELTAIKKLLRESNKSTDELKGKLERQKNSKENWDNDKKDLQSLIETFRAKERQTLVDKIITVNPKFKINKDMTDDFLKGYAAMSVVDNEKRSPLPPKIPSGESDGKITLTEKQIMVEKLLS